MEKNIHKWELSDYDHQFEKHIQITFNDNNKLELILHKWIEINEDYLDGVTYEEKNEEETIHFKTSDETLFFLKELILKLGNHCFRMWENREELYYDDVKEKITTFVTSYTTTTPANTEELNSKINAVYGFYTDIKEIKTKRNQPKMKYKGGEIPKLGDKVVIDNKWNTKGVIVGILDSQPKQLIDEMARRKGLGRSKGVLVLQDNGEYEIYDNSIHSEKLILQSRE